MRLIDAIRVAIAKANEEGDPFDVMKMGAGRNGYEVEPFVPHRSVAEGRDRMLVQVAPKDTEQKVIGHLLAFTVPALHDELLGVANAIQNPVIRRISRRKP